MSGSTGMAPRVPSPRKTTPAERLGLVDRADTSSHGGVRRPTWRSLKTISASPRRAGPKWSSARTVRGERERRGLASRATALLFVSAAKRARDRDGARTRSNASSDAGAPHRSRPIRGVRAGPRDRRAAATRSTAPRRDRSRGGRSPCRRDRHPRTDRARARGDPRARSERRRGRHDRSRCSPGPPRAQQHTRARRMQEIVDREVERGPGTVDRRAGQVWRETRESLTGWGRKPRVRPGRLIEKFSARHRRANSKHGLGAVGVGVFPSLPPVWARVHRRAPSRARRWWRPPRVRWRRTSRTRAPRAGTPRSTSAVASRSRAPGSSDGTRDSTRRGAVASDAPTATARTLEARNLRGEGRRPRSAYSARGMTRARARARPPPLARRSGLGPARNPARRASG